MYHPKSNSVLLWVAKSEFPCGWGVRSHVHEEFTHLYYIYGGSCTFCVGDKEYHVSSKTCINVRPGVKHTIKKVESGEPTIYAYELKYVTLNPQLNADLDAIEPVIVNDPLIDILVEQIVDANNYVGTYYRDYIQSYLDTLIYHLTGKVNKVWAKDAGSKFIDTHGFSQVTKKVVAYIDSNYMNEINLDIIASSIGYTKNYICAIFKKDSSTTVNSYLNYVRICKAAEFIAYSDCSISHVCIRSGFTNLSQYNKTFKRIVGISPGQYRHAFPKGVTITTKLEKDREGYTIPVWSGRVISLADTLKDEPTPDMALNI